MIVLDGMLESLRSLKDRTYKLTFETQELTPEQLARVGENLQQYGFMAFNRNQFTGEMLDALKDFKVDFDDVQKSKSQRLRAVLFVYWKQEPMGYEVFDDFYNFHMSKIIDHFKTKLQ